LQTDSFQKDFKKLSKKYQTLKDDFEYFAEVIADNPTGEGAGLRSDCITRVPEKNVAFYKARMMCRTVRGSSFRVIYMHDTKNVTLLFIEIYFKGTKENNDMERINEICRNYE